MAQAEDVDARLNQTDQHLAKAVARNLYKVMAYKDEYEVARLYSDGQFAENLSRQFEGDYKLNFSFAPPLFSSGKKMTFGPWIKPVLKAMSALKFLRGTAFDVFGYSEDRKIERRLLVAFKEDLETIFSTIDQTSYQSAVDLVSLTDQVRGFGRIKQQSIDAVAGEKANLRSKFG